MKTKYLIAASALLLSVSVALAGYVQPAPVEVTVNADGSGSALGDMVSARFSDNDVEHIGCGIRISSLGSGDYFRWGFCQARDSEGVQGFCSTEDPEILDIMKATSDYSFITFAWDENEECTQIGFSTQSFYIPQHTNGKPKNK